MNQPPLYPLRFEPIYQYRPWGGRRLADLLTTPLPAEIPIGEAWLLSDREDHASVVANGSLQSRTLRQLLEQSPAQMLGDLAGRFPRFPLLLKFLDARDALSIQVHPADLLTSLIPPGETGKTEAWVVLATGAESRVYAGLTPATTADDLQYALASGTVADRLASFRPEPGDTVLIPAGAVHSLRDTVVFEVQENSDVTFRLSDWDHLDATTGLPRPLQIDQAMACIDFSANAVAPAMSMWDDMGSLRNEAVDWCERLVSCENFGMWRLHGNSPFHVGAVGIPRVLVGLAGCGQLEHAGVHYAIGPGDVFLLPASVGRCLCEPRGIITALEISLPEKAPTPGRSAPLRSEPPPAESKSTPNAEMAALLDV